MRETKLYSVLVQLDGFELNRLHRFILSPYFNRNEAIIRLFEWVKDDLKKPNDVQPGKEDLWQLCFGKTEPYNDGRFRKLQSDLLKLIEDYYAQEAFESNEIHKAKFLLEAIYEKDLGNLETGALKSAQKILDDQISSSASYFYYKYEIEKSLYHISLKETERKVKSNLDKIVENLDRFYLIEKLKYYSFILDHQTFATFEYKMLFTEEIIDHVKNNNYPDVPAIQIYFQILLTLIEPANKEHYDLLKDLIEKHLHLFPDTEAKDILDAALNYSLIRMNAGEREFIRETFNLYNKFLESGVLMVNGHITPWSFKNIVTTGLRLNEFEWIENFINTYSQHIEVRYRDNAITFNLAQLFFYKKEYPKVIDLLSKVEYEDFTYNLNSKTLLMASYYELDEFEPLDSLLDSFRLYVMRNKKLTKGKSTHYLNTITFVRKMSKIDRRDSKKVDELIQQVSSKKGIVSKNWILEKLTALKG